MELTNEKIETEVCFVIKCGNGAYLIGSPEFLGSYFHSRDVTKAIEKFSFESMENCERYITILEKDFYWLALWRLSPEPAFKLKDK